MESINKLRAEDRASLAIQLVKLGNKVVAMSEDVRNRQADKLSKVTRKKQDEIKSPVSPPPEEWPPLLSELRGLFWAIEENLSSMNETLDLLEI